MLAVFACTLAAAMPEHARAARSPLPHGAGGAARPGGGAGRPASEDIALARRRPRGAAIAVEPWSPEVFARAKREGKLIVVDGAAAWCHFCHVMEETTWREPAIVRLVGERFVFVRFDVDARPDLGDRYEATGWPATVLLSPEGEELGRYKGFIEAEKLLPILQAAVAGHGAAAGANAKESRPPVEALGWIGRLLARRMDDAFDEENAGWGRRKLPRPGNVLFELVRASRGDGLARERARRTLAAERRLLDPVWGGIFKGNAEPDWRAPHVEKQTIYQGPNLEAFARGHGVLGDAGLLDAARAIDRYLAAFMTSPEGGFFTAQDADVGAHEANAPFVDGTVYYRWGDERRRRAGLPWIDRHVYARENGLAIAGLAALYEASPDRSVLDRARRAAADLLARTVKPDGSVEHDAAQPTGHLFLADAAALGLGFERLGRASGDAALRAAARRIALAIDRNFAQPGSGALAASTLDEGAAGAFAGRDFPLEPAVWAARLFALVGADTGDPAFRRRGLLAIAGSATPERIVDQGPVVGELLMALEELGAGTQ